MQKSFDMIVLETKKEVVEVVNKSGLPLSILAMMFQEMVNQVNGDLDRKLNQEYQAAEAEAQNKEGDGSNENNN